MRQSSFNIVHLAVALLCVVVFVTIAVAVNTSGKPTRPPGWHSTQLRGIHQGMVTYANSNKNFFPGLGSDGQESTEVLDWNNPTIPLIKVGLGIEKRVAVLLEGDFLTPEYLISPSENDPTIHAWDEAGMITSKHYSYAMLQLPDKDGRRDEWAQTLNSQAIVISDRNTGPQSNPTSVHNGPGATSWGGTVLWNDNHVGFEMSDTFETKYGSGKLNEADRLFEANSVFDALLIHSGN